MRRDDHIFLIHNQETNSKIFKMTKAKTAMFLVMIICSCGLIFSITDAYPTPEPEPLGDSKLGNNSRLVITHVVKTIEFEVGVVDDDGLVDENATDSNASEFYETDIQLLNLNLLKEVVNQAEAEEEKLDGTMEVIQPSPSTMKEETTEGQTQQVPNVQLNQTSS